MSYKIFRTLVVLIASLLFTPHAHAAPFTSPTPSPTPPCAYPVSKSFGDLVIPNSKSPSTTTVELRISPSGSAIALRELQPKIGNARQITKQLQIDFKRKVLITGLSYGFQDQMDTSSIECPGFSYQPASWGLAATEMNAALIAANSNLPFVSSPPTQAQLGYLASAKSSLNILIGKPVTGVAKKDGKILYAAFGIQTPDKLIYLFQDFSTGTVYAWNTKSEVMGKISVVSGGYKVENYAKANRSQNANFGRLLDELANLSTDAITYSQQQVFIALTFAIVGEALGG